MGRFQMTPEVLPLVAERFRALADPARLQLLLHLRTGDMTVGELVSATGMQQANVSKHLQVLHQRGFIQREKEGLFVRYTIANPDVFKLCDVMCGHLEQEASERSRLTAGTRSRR